MSSPELTLTPAVKGEVSAAATSVITLARVPMATPGGGQITVSPNIYREWVSLSRATTATGGDVQSFLGWPLEDFTTPAQAEVVYFERGCIIQRPDGRVFAVYGTIYLHYRDLYDLKTGAGLDVGLPTSEEQAVAGGRRSRFDNADIYWDAGANAAFEVHGAIRDKWYALGGYSGFLGYPTTDEMPVMSGGREIGRANQFQGGTIYWSAQTGAFEVHGAIRDAYLHTYNGAVGALGFPISDETPSPSGLRRYNNFQRGCIVWNAQNGAISVYTALDIFIQNINGSGSHTFFESIGASSVWLYANVTISSNVGVNANLHLPPGGGDYGHPSASPGTIYTISPMRADMALSVVLDGWDHCITTSDAHLGTIRADFNVDNDFGINQPQHRDDGDFHGDFDLRARSVDNPNDPNFRRDEFWGFSNPTTATLSREQYAETFVDVESHESDFHWFDDLFYNDFYKGIAAGGNCYGMCLESIYAERNASLFSEPIYPVGEATAIYEVNKKQGYQLGAAYLDWYVANFLGMRFWDPLRVYRESKAAWDAGDLPMICVTATDRSAGHCVRPCGPNAYTETATQCIIEVANPNAPGTNGSDAASRIVIDKATNTYSIALWNGGPTWTGSYLSGGLISWVPFSVVCREPRTPFWEVLTAALGAAMILLGDGATTTQITDDAGRVLYKPERVGTSQRWDDLAIGANAIPGLVRVPRLAAFLSHGPIVGGVLKGGPQLFGDTEPELYRLVGLASPYGPAPTKRDFIPIAVPGGVLAAETSSAAAAVAGTESTASPSVHANGRFAAAPLRTGTPISVHPIVEPLLPPTKLHHEIAGRGSYSWAINTAAAAAVVQVSGSGSGDVLTLERVGAVDQCVTVRAPAGAARTANVMLRSALPPRGASNIVAVNNVAVPAGGSFTASFQPDGKTLQLQNGGADATVTLGFQVGTGAAVTKSLTIPAGKTATIVPDWSSLPATPVHANILASPGGTVETTLAL